MGECPHVYALGPPTARTVASLYRIPHLRESAFICG